MEQARIRYVEASVRLHGMMADSPNQKKQLLVDFFTQFDPSIGGKILSTRFPETVDHAVLQNIVVFTIWKEYHVMLAKITATTNPAVYTNLDFKCRLAYYKRHAQRALDPRSYTVDEIASLNTFEGWLYKNIYSTNLHTTVCQLQELMACAT